jgi:RNA polymerase sigma-70 factor (ECF subfamily)
MQIDLELIKRCRKNQRKAQVELYKKCYPMLMKVCLRYKKNESDAAEMLNIGMLKILDHLSKYHPHVPFEYWVRRIMINTLIDDYRKHKKRSDLIQSIEPEFIHRYEKDQIYNQGALQLDAEAIRKLINTLPEERLQIFNLFALDGYAYQEISEMLGVNVNTLKWHVSEARKYLQKKIEIMVSHKTVKDESVR